MTSSSASLRIGPIEHRILQALDRTRRRVWRVGDEPLAGLTPTQQKHALSSLTDAGLLERIERGTYLVVPRAGLVLVPPLELVGSWFADEPYAVIGQAAAEHHGLTLDTPSIVEVQLARPKDPVTFQGVRYVFATAPRESISADNLRIQSGHGTAAIASPAKLLVLLLNHKAARRGKQPTKGTSLAREIVARGASRGLWAKVDWSRLIRRHGSASAARRLGYLLDREGVPGGDVLLKLRGSAGNVPFSPLYPPAGRIDSSWRLILNDPVIV